MGLDIIAMDFPKDVRMPSDISNEWLPPVIGSRRFLVDSIKEIIPIAKFSSSSSGLILGDDFAVEIRLGNEEECNHIHFTVRSNEKGVGAALEICQLFNIRGIECAGTSFLDSDPKNLEALAKWQDYLHRAVSQEFDEFKEGS